MRLIASIALLVTVIFVRPADASCFESHGGGGGADAYYCGGRDPLGNGCDSGCGARGDCAHDYGQACLGIEPGCGIITGNMKVNNGSYCQTFANNAENTSSSNSCFGKCGKGCSLNCGGGAFCEIHDGAVREHGYFHPLTYPSLAGALTQWGGCWVARPVVAVVQQVKSTGGGIVRWVARTIKFW
jgi:hypothetical protein